ncbi:arylsulfatase [Lentisphaera profundi]|uniref:Arylsulfatase n=1 Tax=Lentisphaera profundi TaxID=1658616 RepID=A0ABY7VU56_9BACT|nr:arylsulfatase [Lentisphaera profundi]WDE97441.1 arylsulfatase [Lentisphaera profundi]
MFILADDMGYGDMSHTGGKAATPHCDWLAAEGMRFTDAHTSSSVCTPTRYGILTGRYNWRSTLKKGVLSGFKPPLIKEHRLTVADYLKNQGYKTAMIGKWHLGIGWQNLPKGKKVSPRKNLVDHPKAKPGIGKGWNVDFTKPIIGPASFGFDSFWGVGASLDMPPYVYLENDRVLGTPDICNSFNRRPGPATEDFDASLSLIKLAQKSRQFIAQQSADKPFFLYLPLTSPHTPVSPSKKWQGKSSIGPYGDFLMETDWVVGEVLSELQHQGLSENTMVIFTADNGCSPDADIDDLQSKGHFPNAPWRGAKSDIFEGGHRVPFIVRWPAQIKAGSLSDSTICTTDFFATAADATGALSEIPANTAEDSFSFLSELTASGKTQRLTTIHHSSSGYFAIRKGDWKLVLCAHSGGRGFPHIDRDKEAIKDLPLIQLYNMKDDPKEEHNLHDKNPETVHKLITILTKEIKDGRITNGPVQANDGYPPFESDIIERFPELNFTKK